MFVQMLLKWIALTDGTHKSFSMLIYFSMKISWLVTCLILSVRMMEQMRIRKTLFI